MCKRKTAIQTGTGQGRGKKECLVTKPRRPPWQASPRRGLWKNQLLTVPRSNRATNSSYRSAENKEFTDKLLRRRWKQNTHHSRPTTVLSLQSTV